jgi:hypothetical protein
MQSVTRGMQRLDVVYCKVEYRVACLVTNAIELELCLSSSVDADLEAHCVFQCHIQSNPRSCIRILGKSMKYNTKIRHTGEGNGHRAVI